MGKNGVRNGEGKSKIREKYIIYLKDRRFTRGSFPDRGTKRTQRDKEKVKKRQKSRAKTHDTKKKLDGHSPEITTRERENKG